MQNLSTKTPSSRVFLVYDKFARSEQHLLLFYKGCWTDNQMVSTTFENMLKRFSVKRSLEFVCSCLCPCILFTFFSSTEIYGKWISKSCLLLLSEYYITSKRISCSLPEMRPNKPPTQITNTQKSMHHNLACAHDGKVDCETVSVCRETKELSRFIRRLDVYIFHKLQFSLATKMKLLWKCLFWHLSWV